MDTRFFHWAAFPLSLALLLASVASESLAQSTAMSNSNVKSDADGKHVDGWHEFNAEDGSLIRTRRVSAKPAKAPLPVFKHELMTPLHKQRSGNSALYYLMAMGFIEQGPARKEIDKREQAAVKRASESKQDITDLPPFSWLETPPGKLPVDDVRDHLALFGFQKPLIQQASVRTRFDLDRYYKDSGDVMGYLLPEIQNIRGLARTQSLRFRLAVAENRLDDAISILRQQLTLARHLGEDDFLVSNLVGIAIAAIAWNDAFYLIEHPQAPNLYWSLSKLPRPLVRWDRPLSVEREFLFLQLKVLAEVDETPRSIEYWRGFLERLHQQMGMARSEFGINLLVEELQRDALVAIVAASYPAAKQYLLEVQKLDSKQVEAYPSAQVVFLALRRFHEQWRDEVFKQLVLPLSQAKDLPSTQDAMDEATRKYGWVTGFSAKLLPWSRGVLNANGRMRQNFELLRTVEALRLHMAEKGELPKSLDDLVVPAPLDPFTDKPFRYELKGKTAALEGYRLPNIQHRIVVAFE